MTISLCFIIYVQYKKLINGNAIFVKYLLQH